MVTLTWKRRRRFWIKDVKGTLWILNWVVSKTFADPDQDRNHQYTLNVRVKAQRSEVPATAGAQARAIAVAEAETYLGLVSLSEKVRGLLMRNLTTPEVAEEVPTLHDENVFGFNSGTH